MLVRRVVLVVLAVVLVAAGLRGPSAQAASLSVAMQSGGSGAANRWIVVGDDLEFSVSITGGTPDSIRWRVDDTAVATVSAEGDQATVTARREGVTRLWVDVTASDGEVVSDSCWVSVAVDVPDTAGAVVRRGAALFRSRSTESTSRGVLGSNATATVWLVSGSWVRVVFADDFRFPEDDAEPGRDAWVLASSVDIPPTSVTLDRDYLTLAVGDAADLTASVAQSYAKDYELAWTSSNTSVAGVDDGTVTGAAEGTATITATASSSHGVSVSDTATASVYTPVTEETLGVTRSRVDVRRAPSTSAPAAASLAAGASLEVAGLLGAWFYVTAGTVEGFVPTSAVKIPVVELNLNPASVVVKPGGAVTVGVTVLPSLATDAALTWSSANPKVAAVDSSGKVSGVKVGSTSVTAVAGGKSVTLPVNVSLNAPLARDMHVLDLAPAKSALMLASVGARQTTLNGYAWGKPGSRYRLQQRVAGGSYRNVTIAFTADLTAARKLTRSFDKAWLGKTVSYRLVKVKPAAGEAWYSNTVTVVAGKPALTVTAESGTAVRLRWAAMTGVKGYRIEAKNSKGKWVKLTHITKASKTTQKVTKIAGATLKVGKTYSFRMVACTKVSTKSCTQVKTAGKKSKAVWSKTAQARTLTRAARVKLAGTEITTMLNGTTKNGGLLYLKGTNIHTTALGKRASHPYVKYVWDAKAGVLELHAFLKFVVDSPAPKGSRSGWTMRSLVTEGLQQIWGNHVVTGSSADFVIGAEFATKVVIHDWDKRVSEKHAAAQKYLEIRIGYNGDCSPNWYSSCASPYQGFHPDSTYWIFIPWDTTAQHSSQTEPLIKTEPKGSVWFTAPGTKLIAAHEFGHTLGLADGYTSGGAKAPDRMMENSETTNDVGNYRYSNLMKANFVYIDGTRISPTILEPNDYEMILSAYKRASKAGLDLSDAPSKSQYASYWDRPASCEIIDRHTDEIPDGDWSGRGSVKPECEK